MESTCLVSVNRELTINMWTCAVQDDVAKFVLGEEGKNTKQKSFQRNRNST